MTNPERYPYTTTDSTLGQAGVMPFLPITLMLESQSLPVTGLLDTGSSVNVLPHPVGVQLGAVRTEQPILTQLGGNLGQFEARGLVLSAQIGSFDPVRFVFAWTEAENVPLILGQVNFFMQFDVCFYRSSFQFEIKPKS